MNLDFSQFVDGRINDVSKELHISNAEYVLTSDKISRLYENIHPIITSKCDELKISHGDCTSFQELLDEELTSAAIIQQALYKQGYLDCVKVLRMLGVLA